MSGFQVEVCGPVQIEKVALFITSTILDEKKNLSLRIFFVCNYNFTIEKEQLLKRKSLNHNRKKSGNGELWPVGRFKLAKKILRGDRMFIGLYLYD